MNRHILQLHPVTDCTL